TCSRRNGGTSRARRAATRAATASDAGAPAARVPTVATRWMPALPRWRRPTIGVSSPAYCQLPSQADVLRRAADHDTKGTGLHDPAHLRIAHPKIVTAETKLHGRLLARIEADPSKASQLHYR